MHDGRSGLRSLAVALAAVVLIGIGAVSLFTPVLGPARVGPMRGLSAQSAGVGMGPMTFGMMREVRAMADVESELEYMRRMIPHHQEAVDSARTLRERTQREEMRTFAEEIIATQTREIEQMESWLAAWYPEQEADADYQPMMRDYEDLSGDELDLAFLEDMIPHHMAAVMMSQQLLAQVRVEHSELETLAASIRDTQTQEIRQMSLWLDEWFN
ncbi:MAG: DUF305 domain-containing protein [Spirochaetaceae bacterium]